MPLPAELGTSMFNSLTGEITFKGDERLCLQVGGVEWELTVSRRAVDRLPPTGQVARVYTYLVHRDDAMRLYGFPDEAERALFLDLQKVDGVGPKGALKMLSGVDREAFAAALDRDDVDALSAVPGVGKKTAQKIVLYLHDRLKPTDALAKIAALSDKDSEVLAALTALGYSVVEAQTAIQSLPKDAPDNVEERLRTALQYFTGH